MRLLFLMIVAVPAVLIALALLSLLAPALRWVFRIGVAAVAALAATAFLPLDQFDGWGGPAVFLLVLVALSIGGRQRPAAPRPTAPAAASPAPTSADWSTRDLGPAWPRLRALADWRTRRRLDVAADRCAGYMAVARAREDAMAGLPIKIEKHLPEQIADCVSHARTATPPEQRALIADTLAAMESVAARAEERRQALARSAQAPFHARHAHLTRPED